MCRVQCSNAKFNNAWTWSTGCTNHLLPARRQPWRAAALKSNGGKEIGEYNASCTLDVMWAHAQMCIDLKDNMLKCENQKMQVPFLGEGDIPKRKPMPLTSERQNFECDALMLSV